MMVMLGEGRTLSFLASFSRFCFVFMLWMLVLIKEARLGAITRGLKRAFRFAFILFIMSEVVFFGSFFWGFFTFSLVPTIEIGRAWPQVGIFVIYGFGVPLLNTVILLSSGVRVTWAHKNILHYKSAALPLRITLILGVVFLFIQISEYIRASFSISDGVYGSIFFLLTGFHGFHVFVGCCMLLACLTRARRFSRRRHVGFECAAWYWHFVDVVWLFLFSFVYLWSKGILSCLSELIGSLW